MPKVLNALFKAAIERGSTRLLEESGSWFVTDNAPPTQASEAPKTVVTDQLKSSSLRSPLATRSKDTPRIKRVSKRHPHKDHPEAKQRGSARYSTPRNAGRLQ